MAGNRNAKAVDPKEMLEDITGDDVSASDTSEAETKSGDIVDMETVTDSDVSEAENTEKEIAPLSESTDSRTVTVKFKNTYTGTLGVYHKKRVYTIPADIAKILEGDLDYVR